MQNTFVRDPVKQKVQEPVGVLNDWVDSHHFFCPCFSAAVRSQKPDSEGFLYLNYSICSKCIPEPLTELLKII